MKKLKILGIALFLSGSLSNCDSERYRAEDTFAGVQKKLMASVSELTNIPARENIVAEPYINGKLVAFQELERRSGDTAKGKTYIMQIGHFRELEDVYATKPEEVGTVALLHCQTLQKGVYTSDDRNEYPAETEDCELTMIDRKKDAVIFRKQFEKMPSPERRAYGNMMIRESSQEDILQFLKALPRK